MLSNLICEFGSNFLIASFEEKNIVRRLDVEKIKMDKGISNLILISRYKSRSAINLTDTSDFNKAKRRIIYVLFSPRSIVEASSVVSFFPFNF